MQSTDYPEVLAETKDWIAINKPSGLIVETNPFECPSVEDLLFQYLRKKEKRPFIGVVHRLDRLTSGVLLFAKKKDALRKLNRQFSERQVKKVYLALLSPFCLDKSGLLTGWLIKDQKNKKAEIKLRETVDAKKVTLSYRLLKEEEGAALVEVHPFTGRFHQIRVQFATAGCPVVGDEKYGSRISCATFAIGLHAFSISFSDPHTGETVIIHAGLPEKEPWDRYPALRVKS